VAGKLAGNKVPDDTAGQTGPSPAAGQPASTPRQLPAIWTAGRLLKSSEAGRLIMLVVALGLLIAVFTGLSGGSEVRPANLLDIATSGALLGIVSVGEVVVMIAGGLDISVGSAAGLVSSVTAIAMMHTHQNVAVGIVAGLAVGLAAGLFNGILVAYFGVNAVIATLATYSGYTGVALLATNGQEVGIASPAMTTLGTGGFLGVPYLVWVLLTVGLAGILIMRYTDIGRQIYAVGGSTRAARLAGIRTTRYTAGVFVASGLCAAVVGILLAAQTGAAQPTEGTAGLELTAITAVLLGGTALAGGSGSVTGAILGVALIATLDNGLILVGLQAFWQSVATGGLLIAAVILQNYQTLTEKIRGLRSRLSG
jgi:ribose transport system permease protein